MSKCTKLLGLTTLLLTVNASAQVATYYGGSFHGRKTASGERFNQYAMTCASNTHAFGTQLKVTNVKNGKSVICRVNDRGGFGKRGVALDLSKGAFAKIAPLSQGRIKVRIERVDVQNTPMINPTAKEMQLPQVAPLIITQSTQVVSRSVQPSSKQQEILQQNQELTTYDSSH